MSPEQAKGGRELDERSDIYSLGAVAYYLLTGRPPFEGEGGIAVLIAHARDPVEPPSRVRPGIPEDLERVVLRCLAKDPAERFPDAESLEQALADCACAAIGTSSAPFGGRGISTGRRRGGRASTRPIGNRRGRIRCGGGLEKHLGSSRGERNRQGRRGRSRIPMGKTVLVTGAGGFIGSHLAERLVAGRPPGPCVRAVQRPRRPRPSRSACRPTFRPGSRSSGAT